jgi:sortase A
VTRWLALLMILAGTLALADGIVTLLWQEPISALIAQLRQDRLSGDLRHVEQASPSLAEQHALAGIADQRRRIVYLAEALERRAANGGPVGRIVIPRIGASFVVVKGTDTSDLESGPGIYSDTSFPGGSGTTAIAGHRTTYLAPFRHIDALAPGNTIRLNMPYARFTYTVVGQRVVSPYDVHAAVGSVGYSRLVLSACTPLFSAAKRLLVFARLTRIVPVGAARPMLGGQLSHPIELPLHPPQPRQLPPVLESLSPYYVAPVS